MSDKFKLGDHVLLIFDRRRRWLKIIEDKEFHCNYGMIDLKDLVGKTYGSSIQTNIGKWIKALPPTLMDWFGFFEHGSQIIYPKDAAMISLLLDAKPGDTIIEAGTGSGALTSVLSRAVGSTGRIITHEVRPSAQKSAIKNHKKLGTDNVIFILQDVIEEGFKTEIDGQPLLANSVVLDLGDPWRVIDQLPKLLILGGKIVAFIPTFQQLEKLYDALSSNGFKEIRGLELIEREIQFKKNAIRPSTRMIGHTGFLMHALLLPTIDDATVGLE